MKPVVIVGTTASGKTALSLFLAKHLGQTDILVVDSKQVYKGQDIVTGKDLPEEFKNQKATVKIFGVDLVDPDEEWSVAHFVRYAREVLEQTRRLRRRLIIVGGTPQFTLSLFVPPTTAIVSRNPILRMELEHLSVQELQARLQSVSAVKFATMNDSDRYNPRRLIRAIEVSQGQGQVHSNKTDALLQKDAVLWVGLTVEQEALRQRIRRRVIERIDHGAIGEYQRLLHAYPHWTPEARAAIGYSEIEHYLAGTLTQEQLIDLWTLHEVQYAKRQMQWWRRETELSWFDAQDSEHQTAVFQTVKDCYN